jgi:L-seryl-tRNA(Ser) seleniumtransferase
VTAGGAGGRIINAAGTLTRLSGGILRPEAVAAMTEAAGAAYDMAALEAHASEVIARLTGAEAGYVTSGASAGLLLATAAAIAGLDPAKMARLPDTAGMRDEVIVARSQRNGYDHAARAAGARLVEVGLSDRGSGAGIRDAEPWEYAAAVSERTAAILHVATGDSRPALPEVVAVARKAGVPVIVDAAAELPPQANLRRFVADGADLVVFSGGKIIGGPQASGILAGKRDLVMSAALQHLDMDVAADLFEPPANLIDTRRLPGLPRHGIGRSCKVGKEAILGLLAALEAFVAEGDAARHRRWLATAQALAGGIGRPAGVEVALSGADDVEAVPKVRLRLADEAAATRLLKRLLARVPPIHADPSEREAGIVVLSPVALGAGEAETVARAVAESLGRTG